MVKTIFNKIEPNTNLDMKLDANGNLVYTFVNQEDVKKWAAELNQKKVKFAQIGNEIIVSKNEAVKFEQTTKD